MASKRPDDVLISLLRSTHRNARRTTPELTRRPTVTSNICLSRQLSSIAAPIATVKSSIGYQELVPQPGNLSQARGRTYATTTAKHGKPQEIAVLGGGITGLTTAFYLARYAENAHITLYEASSSLGGWINGKQEKVADGEDGRVLFQRGARMLRSSNSSMYDDLVLYDVIASLNIEDKIRHLKSVSGTRYIYYPDRLVKMPSLKWNVNSVVEFILSYLTNPLYDGLLRSVRNYFWSYYTREAVSDPKDIEESVGAYLERTCGDDRLIKNVLSGVMHGIYGGDAYKLSAKHTMIESLYYDFILERTPKEAIRILAKDWWLHADFLLGPTNPKALYMAECAIGWNSFTFEDGLLSLVNGLVKDLQKRKNVTIKNHEPVTSLAYKNNRVVVTSGKTKGQAKSFDRVICTLFSKHLAQLVEPKGSLPTLAETHAVTIMVVNLWFPNPDLLSANPGFGYLVPTATPNNDECILGTIFDSVLETRDERPGTKLTVMLGGHYWDGWKVLPTEEMAIQIAKQAVQRQLAIDPNEPVVASARLCRDCLPQHTVGHRARMREAHYELLDAFKGRLSVAGPSYTNVGVIPAMRAGYDAAMRMATGEGPPYFLRVSHDLLPYNHKVEDLSEDHVGETGLRGFTLPEKWLVIHKNYLHFRKFGNSGRLFDEDGNWVKNQESRGDNRMGAPWVGKNGFKVIRWRK
ncbi:Protoporphyrinogen oxidase [Whalleya microplaca]|nr:Protoporphyrinogen oxidase [Whalleya microplaca]